MQALSENRNGLSGHLPTALLPDLFDMFCHHLRNTDFQPPSESSSEAESKGTLVKLSILGLSEFESSYLRGNAKLGRIFRETWPGILTWLQRIEHPEIWHIQPSEAPSVPLLIQSLFMATEYFGVIHDLLGTKEFLEFVTHMLLRDDWKREDVHAISLWFMNLLSLQKDSLKAMGVVERAIIRAWPRTSQAFTVLLNRFYSASIARDAHDMHFQLKLLNHPVMDSTRLKSGFIRAHGMTEILKALQRIAKNPLPRISHPEATPFTVTLSCFVLIIKTFKASRNTPSLVNDSLDKGLLGVMLRFAQDGEKKNLFIVDPLRGDEPLSLIEHFYPTFCIIPSVALHASQAVLKAVSSTHTTTSSMEASRFKFAWVEFNLLLAQRMLFRALHSRRRKRLRCNNVSSLESDHTLLHPLKYILSPAALQLATNKYFRPVHHAKKQFIAHVSVKRQHGSGMAISNYAGLLSFIVVECFQGFLRAYSYSLYGSRLDSKKQIRPQLCKRTSHSRSVTACKVYVQAGNEGRSRESQHRIWLPG